MRFLSKLAISVLLLGGVGPVLAQVPISALPAATTPTSGSDVAPIVQGGVTKKVGLGSLLPNTAVTAGTYGDATHCPSFTVQANGTLSNAAQSTSCPGGSPGGSDTQLQYKNGSSFGGISGATTNGTIVTLTSPVLVTPALGTPASAVLSNATGLPPSTGLSTTVPVNKGGTGITSFGTGVAAALGTNVSGTGAICLASGSACSGGGGSGTVTQVDTGACMTGGPITTTGTIEGTYDIRAVTGTTDTILSGDACKLVTYSNGSAVAVDIPAPTGSFGAGFGFDTENKGAGTVTFTPLGGALVNGAATLAVATNRGCTLVSDGTGWQVSACSALIGAGTGSVTSVAATVPGGFSISGSPVTTSGTLAIAANGTSGGVVCYTGSTTSASSSALTANLPVIGGGAGVCPSVGTRSGNTTAYVTTTGSQTSGDVASIDASGNHVASGTALSNLVTTNTAQTITASKRGTVQTLTISTATFTPNFDTGNNFKLTLINASCPCTIANPSTTPVAGQSGIIEIIQSATGSDTVGTWGSQYVAAGGVATLTLSTAANAKDYASYYVVDSTHILVSLGALNASH